MKDLGYGEAIGTRTMSPRPWPSISRLLEHLQGPQYVRTD